MALTPVWDVAPHPNATDRERPGTSREHDIQPIPGGMTPPPWPDVPNATRAWVDAINDVTAADAGDPGPLGEMLARSVMDNLYRFVVPAVAGPNRLVPLAALADTAITEGALRVAANRGRLRAQKGQDGQWRSTRAWADEYISTRHRRS